MKHNNALRYLYSACIFQIFQAQLNISGNYFMQHHSAGPHDFLKKVTQYSEFVRCYFSDTSGNKNSRSAIMVGLQEMATCNCMAPSQNNITLHILLLTHLRPESSNSRSSTKGIEDNCTRCSASTQTNQRIFPSKKLTALDWASALLFCYVCSGCAHRTGLEVQGGC